MCSLELARRPSHVTLAPHIAGSSIPFGVTTGLAYQNACDISLQKKAAGTESHRQPSQRSLHDAPIFRLLLKVAVNGTHQCDFPNF